MKINWSIRFNAKNKAFLYRVALAIALPILTYFTTKGLSDSERALSYTKPRED